MVSASRTPTHVKAAKAALATGQVVPAAPAAAAAAPTQAEFNSLRTTVVELRAALVKAGVVKAS